MARATWFFLIYLIFSACAGKIKSPSQWGAGVSVTCRSSYGIIRRNWHPSIEILLGCRSFKGPFPQLLLISTELLSSAQHYHDSICASMCSLHNLNRCRFVDFRACCGRSSLAIVRQPEERIEFCTMLYTSITLGMANFTCIFSLANSCEPCENSTN